MCCQSKIAPAVEEALGCTPSGSKLRAQFNVRPRFLKNKMVLVTKSEQPGQGTPSRHRGRNLNDGDYRT